MKNLTLKQLKRIVHKIDEQFNEEDASYKAMVVLLSSVQIGPNTDKLAKFTKYPRSLVRRFGRNLRENGVWVGGKVAGMDWFEEGGSVSLICDSLVAIGILERAPEKKTNAKS